MRNLTFLTDRINREITANESQGKRKSDEANEVVKQSLHSRKKKQKTCSDRKKSSEKRKVLIENKIAQFEFSKAKKNDNNR